MKEKSPQKKEEGEIDNVVPIEEAFSIKMRKENIVGRKTELEKRLAGLFQARYRTEQKILDAIEKEGARSSYVEDLRNDLRRIDNQIADAEKEEAQLLDKAEDYINRIKQFEERRIRESR